ncbi:MAG: hypothetical protein BGO78_17520 [Chloroflexi bacterium 44-23]|nr:MAG: hypothetical protein BGO78_17520 [Chloroflexi bacterium 44-23]
MKNGCILIPAYNEEKHLGAVIAKAIRFMPVIVIDDGSHDETVKVAKAAGAEVFQQIPNQGKGAALQRGFAEAIRKRCDFLVTLDADGQHDPLEIPKFLEAYRLNQPDLIIGFRDFTKMPFIRRLSNTTGSWAFSWAMRQPIRDNQSGYRLLSRDLYGILLHSQESGFEYEVEMIVQCIEHGLKLDWVPIETIYADETSHIRPLHHVVNFLRVVIDARKRSKPKIIV